MTRGLVEQTSHTRDRHEPRWRRPGVSSSGVPLTAEQEAAAAAAAAAGGGTGDLIPLEADEQALFYLYQQKYNLDMTSLRLTSELGMRKGMLFSYIMKFSLFSFFRAWFLLLGSPFSIDLILIIYDVLISLPPLPSSPHPTEHKFLHALDTLYQSGASASSLDRRDRSTLVGSFASGGTPYVGYARGGRAAQFPYKYSFPTKVAPLVASKSATNDEDGGGADDQEDEEEEEAPGEG